MFLRTKYERIKQGLSQASLGRRAGLTQATICLIEQGRLIPTPQELERLARALGITSSSVLLKEVTVRDPDEEARATEPAQQVEVRS